MVRRRRGARLPSRTRSDGSGRRLERPPRPLAPPIRGFLESLSPPRPRLAQAASPDGCGSATSPRWLRPRRLRPRWPAWGGGHACALLGALLRPSSLPAPGDIEVPPRRRLAEAAFSQNSFPALNALLPLLEEPKAGHDSLKFLGVGKCVKGDAGVRIFNEFQSLY